MNSVLRSKSTEHSWEIRVMKLHRIVLAAGLLLAFSASAFAQRIKIEAQPLQRQPIGAVGETPLLTPAALEKLMFTADQKDKYSKIEADYKDTAKDLLTKLRN